MKLVKGELITFEEGCNRYIDYCRYRNLREGTIRHYKQIFKFFSNIEILVAICSIYDYYMIMKNIKKLREESGLSLRKVEKLTGIGFSYLGKLEKEDVKLTPSILKKLCDFYSVDSSMITDLSNYIVYVFFDGKEIPLSDYEYEKFSNSLCAKLIDGRIKRYIKDENKKEVTGYLYYREQFERKEQKDLIILNSLKKLSIDGLFKARNLVDSLLKGGSEDEQKRK